MYFIRLFQLQIVAQPSGRLSSGFYARHSEGDGSSREGGGGLREGGRGGGGGPGVGRCMLLKQGAQEQFPSPFLLPKYAVPSWIPRVRDWIGRCATSQWQGSHSLQRRERVLRTLRRGA